MTFWTLFNVLSFLALLLATIFSFPNSVKVNHANFTAAYPSFATSLGSDYDTYDDTKTLLLATLARSGKCKSEKADFCYGNVQKDVAHPWFHYRVSTEYATDFYDASASTIKLPLDAAATDDRIIFEPPACYAMVNTYYILSFLVAIIWLLFVFYHAYVWYGVSWAAKDSSIVPSTLQRLTLSVSIYMYIGTIIVIIFFWTDRYHLAHCEYLSEWFMINRWAHLCTSLLLAPVGLGLITILVSVFRYSNTPALKYEALTFGV